MAKGTAEGRRYGTPGGVANEAEPASDRPGVGSVENAASGTAGGLRSVRRLLGAIARTMTRRRSSWSRGDPSSLTVASRSRASLTRRGKAGRQRRSGLEARAASSLGSCCARWRCRSGDGRASRIAVAQRRLRGGSVAASRACMRPRWAGQAGSLGRAGEAGPDGDRGPWGRAHDACAAGSWVFLADGAQRHGGLWRATIACSARKAVARVLCGRRRR